jgi:hypothetical protein
MAKLESGELQRIRDGVARLGSLSDSVIKVGPLSLGLDGLLAWAPGVGELYSAAAGSYMLVQGVRAGVSPAVLAGCAGLLFGRTALTAIPLAGPLAADLLTAHKWSARLITSAIDRKLARLSPVQAAPAWTRWGAPLGRLVRGQA